MNKTPQQTIQIIIASLKHLTESTIIALQEKRRTSALDQHHHFTFWKDQLRTETGIVLTEHLLRSAGIDEQTMHSIQRNNFGKPFLPNHTLDFNISHSGDYVVAVCSPRKYVGIDIEQNRAIDITAYQSIFHSEEWTMLKKSPQLFFELWTKKESLLKAKGMGFQVDLTEVNIFDKQSWPDGIVSQPCFHRIDIPEYTCFVCSSFSEDQVEIGYCNSQSELLSFT
jgi:4'-phosphopantetheinyl transferase